MLVELQPDDEAGDEVDVAPGVQQDVDQDGVADELDAAPDDPDRDGDGLCDGPRDVAGTCVGGEDLNNNGIVDPGETDPRLADTEFILISAPRNWTAITSPTSNSSTR